MQWLDVRRERLRRERLRRLDLRRERLRREHLRRIGVSGRDPVPAYLRRDYAIDACRSLWRDYEPGGSQVSPALMPVQAGM